MTAPYDKIGRFQVASVLGQGGMGIVLRAWDPVMSRDVALKVLERATPHYRDVDTRRRFQQEARAAGKLRHPGTVAVFDLGEDVAGDFIVMELVVGPTLQAVIAEGAIDPLRAAEIAAQIAEALEHAHSHGLVHRDVKPGNIMLPTAGGSKLLDFGLAKVPLGTRTQTGAVLGTPYYVAPEYIAGGTADARSDQFALGVVLYEMLCGDRPFTGHDFPQVAHAIVKTEPPDLARRSSSPTRLVEIVARMMAKNPGARFASCADVADALRGLNRHDGPRRGASLTDEQLALRLIAAGAATEASLLPARARAQGGEGLVRAIRALRVVDDKHVLAAAAACLELELLDDAAARSLEIFPADDVVPRAVQESHGLLVVLHDRTHGELRVLVPLEQVNDALPALFHLVRNLTARPVLALASTIATLRTREIRAAPTQSNSAPRRRVLVVDPRPGVQRAARELARLTDDDVTVTRGVEEASGYLSPGAFELIVASGLSPATTAEFLEHVRLHAPGTEVRVNDVVKAMTASGMDQEAVHRLIAELLLAPARAMGLDAEWLRVDATAHAAACVAAARLLNASEAVVMSCGTLGVVAAVERAVASAHRGQRVYFQALERARALPSVPLYADMVAGKRFAGADPIAHICAAAEIARTLKEANVVDVAGDLRLLARTPFDGRVVEAVLSAMGLSVATVTTKALIVLVVDADRQRAARLALRLRNEGMNAEELHDGALVEPRVERGGIGLVVADVVLPGKDGLGLCLALAGRVPVLLWTERVSSAEIARALKLGATDVLPKDLDEAVLIAKIERHLKDAL